MRLFIALVLNFPESNHVKKKQIKKFLWYKRKFLLQKHLKWTAIMLILAKIFTNEPD